MKIALVTETYPPEVNGVAMTLHRIVDGLRRRGHDVEVTRPRQHRRDLPETPVNGTRSRECTVRGLPLPGYPDLKFGLPARTRMIRRWRAWRPDVVHVATEGPLGWSAISAAKRIEVPVASSFHTNFHTYSGHYGFGLFRSLGLRYLRFAHNRTRRTFVPSNGLLRQLDAEGFRNLALLGRGVDTVLFDPARRDAALRAEWGADERTPVVVYVGRIAPEKNLPLVVRAFEAFRAVVPAAKLVLVGDGPARSEIERAHPDYRFVGMRRGEDLARHYASGDLFFFPSVTETFGNVVTEALASGLVVLAYDYAAAAEHVVDGINGRVVPFDDAGAFVDAASALGASRDRWDAIRRSARSRALDVTWDRVVDRFVEDLAEVAREEG